ncbi:hypothetical protein B0O99DRAFT_597986 [Bisporella sp. PMI_857]|nr:hypothetical protein B0O99DRAFT_597986 [Bisporella sp. PMI_857]
MSHYAAGFQILNDLNYTANCTIATLWHRNQTQTLAWHKQEYVGLDSNMLNVAFIASAWPPQEDATKTEMNDFYNAIYITNVGSWIQVALTAIEANCLGPALAEKVAFADLNPAMNCYSTAAFYANAVCAVNPKKDLGGQSNATHLVPMQVNGIWGFQRMATSPLALDSTVGLEFLRRAWPYDASGITDETLRAWVRIAVQTFNIVKGAATVCEQCLPQLCKAMEFDVDTDIDGIGIMIAYTIVWAYVLIGAVLRLINASKTRTFSETLCKAAETAYKILIGFCALLVFGLSTAGFIILKKLTSYYECLMIGHAVLLSVLALTSTLLMVSEQDFEENIDQVNRWLLVPIFGITSATFIAIITKLAAFKPGIYSDEACMKAAMSRALFHPRTWSWALLILLVLISLVAFWIWLAPPAIKRRINLHQSVTLVALVFGVMMVTFDIVMMWIMRTNMHNITGIQAGNNWGIGQILAILGLTTVPAPFVIAFLIAFVKGVVSFIGDIMLIWALAG